MGSLDAVREGDAASDARSEVQTEQAVLYVPGRDSVIDLGWCNFA